MMQKFVQEMKNLVADMINQLHTALPGRIESYDTGTGQATVLPLGKYKLPNGTSLDYPKITGVPVLCIQAAAQSATIALPVKAGDTCLLIIAEQALDDWLYDAESQTDLKFDLTNCIAIPGLFAQANGVVADACNQNAVIIDCGKRITVDKSGVTISGDVKILGKVTIEGELVARDNVYVEGQVVAGGDVIGAGISLSTHVHGGVQAGGGTTSGPS